MSDQAIQEAIIALEKKDQAQARAILVVFLRQNPKNAKGWRILAQCVDRKEDIVYCLERVVHLDPNDQEARQALARLTERGQRTISLGTQLRDKPISSDQSLPETEDQDLEYQLKAPHPRRNWALIIGGLLVLLIIFLAIAGPSLAPNDPLEENIIIKIGEKWFIPPFEFFTPGFPLGSDNFGRDLFSRLLWAIRPTMIMVSIVAASRMVIGIVIGLLAGWLTPRAARMVDSLIEIALAIPVLLIALGTIALVGVELGIWAFVIGLSLTGWVDTAQQVREQTRIVKSQSFIEAAQSLGASSRQILIHHVLKQITPMIAMLFAFEISSTLMTTAGLGFLGYYIGGDVWVEVSDFVYRRTSGMPELGQMLATSWVTLTQPWTMVVVGTAIFITVLGFNLLGEGLRLNLNFMVIRRRGLVTQLSERGGLWLDQHVWHPLSTYLGQQAVRVGLSGVLVLMVVGSGIFILSRRFDLNTLSNRLVSTKSTSETVPASQGPEATETGSVTGNADQIIDYHPSVAWELEVAGFEGGPALSPTRDRLYAVSTDGALDCFDLDGNLVWTTDLVAGGVGTPAVNSAGDIFVTDDQAGLNRIKPQGELAWRFESSFTDRSLSGPSIGPKGVLYYTVGTNARGYVQAVSPEGKGIWVTPAKTSSFFQAPIPSPDGQYVFLKDDVFSANSGELLELESDFKVLRYFSGLDSQNYMLAGNNVFQWQLNGSKVQILDKAEWDTSDISQVVAPAQVGVTADRVAWMVYTSPGGSTKLVWVSLDDRVIGEANYSTSAGQAIALQTDFTAFVCGGPSFNQEYAKCALLPTNGNEPLWEIDLGQSGRVQGGVWLDEKLYVTTSRGKLIAIAVNGW